MDNLPENLEQPHVEPEGSTPASIPEPVPAPAATELPAPVEEPAQSNEPEPPQPKAAESQETAAELPVELSEPEQGVEESETEPAAEANESQGGPPEAPEAEAPGAPKATARNRGAAPDPALLEEIAKMAQAAARQRLPAAEEERAAGLLRQLLAGGRAAITAAVTPMVSLPWIVSVNAVNAVWAELSVPMRRHLLACLGRDVSDAGRRLRLSLARALFKLEPAAGLKMATAVATDLREPETGVLSGKSRQAFLSVFIGKGKPWLIQLPLGDIKGSGADHLVQCAVETLSLCMPISQLSILRWIHQGGKLKKLQPSQLETVAKAVSRWNPKLQRQLKAEVDELPEPVIAVLKPEVRAARAPAEDQGQAAPEPLQTDETEGEPVETAPLEGGAQAVESDRRETEEADRERESEEEESEGSDAEETGADRAGEADAEPLQLRDRGRPHRPEARFREERRDEKGRRAFDFREALRGLDGYIASLRSELDQTRMQVRRKEDDLKRVVRPRAEEKPHVDVDALVRHNAQLESTVEQLRQQLEDIASHDEAVAESRRLHTEDPLPEGSADQLRALLAIRLQESYTTFTDMRAEPLDKVFRLDYRDLLGSVFDVLAAEGVRLLQTEPK